MVHGLNKEGWVVARETGVRDPTHATKDEFIDQIKLDQI
jgi:hypothetical protein